MYITHATYTTDISSVTRIKYFCFYPCKMCYNEPTEVITNYNMAGKRRNITAVLMKAASETLLKREKKGNKRRIPFWKEDIATLVKSKNVAYVNYLQDNTENRSLYHRISAFVKREVRNRKRQEWERFFFVRY